MKKVIYNLEDDYIYSRLRTLYRNLCVFREAICNGNYELEYGFIVEEDLNDLKLLLENLRNKPIKNIRTVLWLGDSIKTIEKLYTNEMLYCQEQNDIKEDYIYRMRGENYE